MRKVLAFTTIAGATLLVAACEQRDERVRYYCEDGYARHQYCFYTNDPESVMRMDPRVDNLQATNPIHN